MKAIALILLVNVSGIVFGQVDPVDEQGLAIGGYDVVSYFTEGKARKGEEGISAQFNGATYRFSSLENKKRFEQMPSFYLPQYEGYCALAVATSAKKISINPELFKVTDNKLYLFYHGKLYSGNIFNSIEPWLKNEQDMIKKADRNWPTTKTKKYARSSRY